MANVADSESTARCEFSLVTTVHTDFRSESECLIRQPVPYRCDTCYGRASQTYCINLTRHLLWYRIRLILIMTDCCGSLFVCACERLSEGDYPHIVEKFPNDKWNYPTILSCSIFVVAFFYSNVFLFFFFIFHVEDIQWQIALLARIKSQAIAVAEAPEFRVSTRAHYT